MRINRKKAEKALKKLENKYGAELPFSNYIHYGLATVKMIDPAAPEEKKNDFCIVVNLRKKLPKSFNFPSEIDGVRIFTRVIGNIKPLKDKGQ